MSYGLAKFESCQFESLPNTGGACWAISVLSALKHPECLRVSNAAFVEAAQMHGAHRLAQVAKMTDRVFYDASQKESIDSFPRRPSFDLSVFFFQEVDKFLKNAPKDYSDGYDTFSALRPVQALYEKFNIKSVRFVAQPNASRRQRRGATPASLLSTTNRVPHILNYECSPPADTIDVEGWTLVAATFAFPNHACAAVRCTSVRSVWMLNSACFSASRDDQASAIATFDESECSFYRDDTPAHLTYNSTPAMIQCGHSETECVLVYEPKEPPPRTIRLTQWSASSLLRCASGNSACTALDCAPFVRRVGMSGRDPDSFRSETLIAIAWRRGGDVFACVAGPNGAWNFSGTVFAVNTWIRMFARKGRGSAPFLHRRPWRMHVLGETCETEDEIFVIEHDESSRLFP